MNLKQSFLILFFLPSLYANQVAPTKLETVKSHLMPIKQSALDNKKTLKNSAKVIAALCLLKGLYGVWDDRFISICMVNGTENQFSNLFDAFVSPIAYTKNIDTGNYHFQSISVPPYLTALAISSYLLGYKDIYVKLKHWCKNHLAITNEHALHIMKDIAKISGALLLLKGHYTMMHDQITIIRPDIDQPLSYIELLKAAWSPTEMVDDDEEADKVKEVSISRPPYISALGISAYLIGTGSYSIYKEVRDMVQEFNEKKKNKKTQDNHA